MDNATRLGLDVHKETIAVALLRPNQETPDERVIPNTPEALRALVAPHRSRLIACYEAGPTGYDTYRQLRALGIDCEVIAPTLIPRRAGRRVKTDRLDARNLLRLHRAGELTAIRVPSSAEEALRDLIRVREDLKDDRGRTQRRVKSFLLRQGRRYPGTGSGWTDKYDLWVRSQHFAEPAAEAAFRYYLGALDTRRSQEKAIQAEIESAAEAPPLAEAVGRLRCLRGIGTLFAVTIAAEVCDFRRFPSAASFMAFTGLVPSEHSSGARERRGSITKAGNAHLRWVLVEAAWSYRHRPGIGGRAQKAQRRAAAGGRGLRVARPVPVVLEVPPPRCDQGPQRRGGRGRSGAGRVRLGDDDRPNAGPVIRAWERVGVYRGRILADSMRLTIRVPSLRQLPTNP